MRVVAAVFAALLTAPTPAADPTPLPADWHGEWVGELVIFAPDGKTTKVPMSLSIGALDRGAVSWKVVYGDGEKKVVKDYKLLPADKAGRFRIDEGNGIVLDARLDGAVLVSVFEVGGAVLTSRDELLGGKLRHEVTGSKAGEKTGGQVRNYTVTSVQRAELTRKGK